MGLGILVCRNDSEVLNMIVLVMSIVVKMSMGVMVLWVMCCMMICGVFVFIMWMVEM